jgi:hypothetical protein
MMCFLLPFLSYIPTATSGPERLIILSLVKFPSAVLHEAKKKNLIAITYSCIVFSSDDRVVTSPSAVGWPPVHTSRRNIVSAMHVITNKQTAGASSAVAGNGGTPPGSTTTATHTGGGETNGAAAAALAARPALAASSMFAKVHMEGYAIGRKVNLRAQDGYDSLSRTLTNMATNFFCRKSAPHSHLAKLRFFLRFVCLFVCLFYEKNAVFQTERPNLS